MEGVRYWIETEGAGHWFFLAFPVCLLCLFVWFKGRRVRFLIPSLIMSLVIINPWFYKKWDELGLYAYWRILWVVPVIPVAACLVPSITEKTRNACAKAIGVVIGVGLVVFGGTFLYNGPGGAFLETAQATKLPDEVVALADKLLKLEDNPRVIAQYPLGVYMRQYTGSIDTLYGRDIDKYILMANSEASRIHNQLSIGEFEPIAQFMLDDGYDYLVYSGDAGDRFELIDSIGNYGIYKANGSPSVIKTRDEYGRVNSITYVDEKRHPVNNEYGYSTISYTYDNNGYIIREFHTDRYGFGVGNQNGIAGYERDYDDHAQLIMERAIGTEGNPIMGYQNYAEIRYEYKDGKVVKESYYDISGEPIAQSAGHVAISQGWDGNKLLVRTYLDASNQPMNRVDGYAKADWSSGNVCFYNSDGLKVPIEGINLFKERKVGIDGWSDWFMPTFNVKNYCVNLGSVNLGDKSEGDIFSCQIEIEFRGVSTSENGTFWFRSQGAQDGKWFTDNVWNSNLIDLREPPDDGVYHFNSTVTISTEMSGVSEFEIELRCDNWASGCFRVRHVKIEKGNQASDWSFGI